MCYALCFNLIDCSSGDNNAVSVVVNPVFSLIGAEAVSVTAIASGCESNGGVFKEASLEFFNSSNTSSSN